MARKQNGCSAKREGERRKRSRRQRGAKLPAALRLLVIIYRVVSARGASPGGASPELGGVTSLGPPQPHGGQQGDAGWDLGSVGLAVKLQSCKTPWFKTNSSSDGKRRGSFRLGGSEGFDRSPPLTARASTQPGCCWRPAWP